jgi:hypothetical protein
MSKIKSIKVIKDYKFSLWDKTLEDLIKLNPEAFEVEYEKLQILKRPDGSVISGLEDGTRIVEILDECGTMIFRVVPRYDNDLDRTYSKNSHYRELAKGLIYLPEDKHLAEKKAQMLSKQFEIQFEIDKLNAEESEKEKNFFLKSPRNNSKVVVDMFIHLIPENWKMSEKTAETILAKYSQDELKQYLGIII